MQLNNNEDPNEPNPAQPTKTHAISLRSGVDASPMVLPPFGDTYGLSIIFLSVVFIRLETIKTPRNWWSVAKEGPS